MPLIIGLSMLMICIIMGIFNWNKKNHAIYLILYYAIVGELLLANNYIFYQPSLTGIYIFYLHFAPLWLCAGVLLFFYVKSNLDNKDILQNKYHYLHFIPAIIQFFALAKYYVMDKSEKMEYVKIIFNDSNRFFRMEIPGVYFNQVEYLILRPTSMLIYCLICLYLLIKKYPLFREKMVSKEMRTKKYQMFYIWILIVINLILAINMIFAFYQVAFLKNSLNNSAFFYTRGFLFTNLFGQIGSLFLFPSILYGIVPIQKKLSKTKVLIPENESDIPNELKILGDKVREYITHEKPYLHPNFNKSDLSIHLKIAPKDLNDVFELILKEKFSALKNRLRVQHAKELLENGEAEKLTMDGIGYNAGFASRSSFYSIFKSETGFTPIEYVEKVIKHQ